METTPVQFKNPHGFRNRAGRLLWALAWALLFRPTPWFMGAWRTFLLRCFGAKIKYARFHPSVKVWAPWLLETGEHVYVDARVNLYNAYGIRLGDRVIISQGSFLCSATHDYTRGHYPLIGGAIVVENDSWIAAEAFVGPGVTIAAGTVVGARAVLVKNQPGWSVLAGNPAKVVKARKLEGAA